MSSSDPMVCERHPDREWPHDGCPGPGMPGDPGGLRAEAEHELALLCARAAADGIDDLGALDYTDAALGAHRAALTRACNRLEGIAATIDELPPRIRRKVMRSTALRPEIIRNEAERGRDTLSVYGNA